MTTTDFDKKTQIIEESFKDNDKYANFRPMSCEYGNRKNRDFSKKMRQIGEVYYIPSYETEEIRHLKVSRV